MSTEGLGLEQPAVERPQVEAAAPETPVEQAAVAEPETDDEIQEVGAFEIKPGVAYVEKDKVDKVRQTLGTKIGTLERRLKELEPASQEAAQLRQYIAEAKPYIEFLKNNPHLLQPQAAPAPQAPQVDTEAEEYARDFDLYDKQGQLDVGKARRILDKNAKSAREAAAEAAQSVTGPVAETLESHAVLGVIQQLYQEKDADNNPINPVAIKAVSETLVNTLGQKGARAFLANPQSYGVLQQMAWGAHAKIPKKATVKPPAHDPLVTERAGGRGEDVTVSTQHLGRLGLSEDKYKAAARNFKPGQFNALE